MSGRPKRTHNTPTHGPALVAYRATSKTRPASPDVSLEAPATKRKRKTATTTKAPKKIAKPAATPSSSKKKPRTAASTPAVRSSKTIDDVMSEGTAHTNTPEQRHSPTNFPFFSPEKDDDVVDPASPLVPDNNAPITIDFSDDDHSQNGRPSSFIGSNDISSSEDEEQELLLEVPTPDGDVRISIATASRYSTLLSKLYKTIGCSEVKTKPILRAQTGANPKAKDSKLALSSQATWEVVVEDALGKYNTAIAGKGKKAEAARASQPKVKILLDDDYIRNLQHTRALAKASGGGNGNKRKRGPIDLNASDPEDATPSNYDLSDRQRNASKEVNAEYKLCKIGRCNGPCVRIDDTHCTPVSQAMLSTLIDAIANETPGVTVTNPPHLPLFNIWPGRTNAARPRDEPSPRRAYHRSRDRFSPYRPSHHRSYRAGSPVYSQNPASARTPAAPMVAINSTSFTSLTDPSIDQFLTSLHAHPDYSRRNLDRLVSAFETRDFYSISAIANYTDLELTQRVPEVTAGNAVFILSAITQYLRSVPT